MACTAGYVVTGTGRPVINTCISTSGKTVNVTLEGQKTETWPFQGYVRFILQVESSGADAWTQVSAKNGGYWANSSTSNKNVSFTGIGYSGKTMRVVSEFYTASNYTGKLSSSAEHIFYKA